ADRAPIALKFSVNRAPFHEEQKVAVRVTANVAANVWNCEAVQSEMTAADDRRRSCRRSPSRPSCSARRSPKANRGGSSRSAERPEGPTKTNPQKAKWLVSLLTSHFAFLW